MRPVIKSTKHLVQIPFDPILTGTAEVKSLITTVNVVNKDTSVEIEEGAIVKACYVELWSINASSDGHEIVTLTKRSNNQSGLTFAEMGNLFAFPEKKNIFFTHQGLSSSDNAGSPTAVMRGWYKIPKSKQRFGLGDTLALTISNPSSTTLNICGFALYKEYT